jgi:hypothetical protein
VLALFLKRFMAGVLCCMLWYGMLACIALFSWAGHVGIEHHVVTCNQITFFKFGIFSTFFKL